MSYTASLKITFPDDLHAYAKAVGEQACKELDLDERAAPVIEGAVLQNMRAMEASPFEAEAVDE